MERLTFRHNAPYSKFHQKAESCEPINCMDTASQGAVSAIVARLADYEDSGKTPEQVREWANAERDERLVVLPCRVERIKIKSWNFNKTKPKEEGNEGEK